MSRARQFDRWAFSLLEIVVAVSLAAVVVFGAITGVRFFTRPAGRDDLTIDQIQDLQLGAEKLDRDLRDARQIIYPVPGSPPTRILYFRDFEGLLAAYYHSPSRRELRRATFDLAGLPTEPPKAPASDLDAALFTVAPNGLVSWGLFGPGKVLLGTVKRKNQ